MKNRDCNTLTQKDWSFGGFPPYSGVDFSIKANTCETVFDTLVFFDSRGGVGRASDSLARKITDLLEKKGKTYLCVVRPLNLTMWATLGNFLEKNHLKFDHLITNMGFVDFTPKKYDLVLQAQEQVKMFNEEASDGHRFVEKVLNKGHPLNLYALKYTDKYLKAVNSFLGGFQTLVINTPLFDDSSAIPRERPKTFYCGLKKSQMFNVSLENVSVVNLPTINNEFSYDAVHYTDRGLDYIFEKVKNKI